MKIRYYLLLTGVWTLCSFSSQAQLKIIENGNVGIGITTPTSRLHLVGLGLYGSGSLIKSGNYTNFSETSSGTSNITWGAYHDGTNWVRAYTGGGLTNVVLGTLDNFSIQTDPNTSGTPNFVDRLTINSSGNVGIGTTSPNAKLSILGENASDATPPPVNLSLRSVYASGTAQHGIGFFVNSSTYLGSGIFAPPGALSFFTSSDWSSTNAVERMRIGSDGNATFSGSIQAATLKINGGDSYHYLMADGSTSTGSTYTGNLSSGYLPKWNGSAFVNSLISDNGTSATISGNTTLSGDLTCNGVDASTIYASSSIQSEYTIESHYGDIHTSGGEVSGLVGRFGQVIEESDQNIKTNITNLPSSSDKLFSLRPVTYNLTSQAKPDSRIHMGFIAQEVKEIIPDMVYENKDGLLGISYTQLIPVLVQTVKDQNDKIKGLEDRITRLESLIK